MANRREIDLYLTDLHFRVFSSADLRNLSVLKVITGLTFDSLGRALPGGLYDPVMGAQGRLRDACQTCFSLAACHGHFGHIELNALVYNPFFIKLIYSILKMSCLKCYRLQIPTHIAQVVAIQIDLVNAGYITEAQDLEIFHAEKAYFRDKNNAPETDETTLPKKLQEMQELLRKEKTTTEIEPTKTSIAILSAIINSAQEKKTRLNCMFCQKPLKKIRYLYKKLVMYISKQERQQLMKLNVIAEDINVPHKAILADECRNYLRQIYSQAPDFLARLFPILKKDTKAVESPVDSLFMDVILVSPPKARPTNFVHGEILEHPQTAVYRNIINSNSVLRLVLTNIKNTEAEMSSESKVMYEATKGNTPHEKMYYAWQNLQADVDQLLDVSDSKNKLKTQGLKQLLEKKEGLIRKHMMGKRVNYAARTVITPDPNINVDEVGIPDIFAKKLSYPVPVTSWNIAELRKMVMNGPQIHPGANYIEDEKGFKLIIPEGDPSKRESMAKLLLSKPENGVKIVHRHLVNGDMLLFNRQPSLHKPSIMGHKARILPSEKTFRLHYSNCKAYNADFDGDEMNAHFPQNEVARSEAHNLVNVANQYLVPKDGTPLGGLIQDHIISAVKLTVRGRFFNREDYHQLVYQGLSQMKGSIKLLPPAILKPTKLWSGKQVVSTIIKNIIPEGYPAINLTSTAKINAKAWQTQRAHRTIYGGTPIRNNEMSESEVIIRKGDLLCGIVDKQQIGATPYGLVHCMFELYGGECSTSLLTSFTKLLTYFLKQEGFTLGVHDILLTPEADEERRKIINECRQVGNAVVAELLGLDENISTEELTEKIDEAYKADPKFRVLLDRKYKTVLDNYTNNINKACLPDGLLCKFPENNLQLMILSGAKGSLVNAMQISCLLGQIELEGKRPPLMPSGKSLPSFELHDTSPRAGGFVDGRFMTGIKPQEFFFHCMAGREGLIDTAVKTSRSGYLQRCLIKHLEGLNVHYDLTVRDSDNCVVQFLYGEDGMDVCKSPFFNEKNMQFLSENIDVIKHSSSLDDKEVDPQLHKYHKKLKAWRKKNPHGSRKQRLSTFKQFSAELRNEIEVKNPKKLNKSTGRLKIDEKIIELWRQADAEQKNSYSKKYSKCPDPLNSKFKPDSFYGAVSEYLENLIENYTKKNPGLKNEVKEIIFTKAMRSMACPGEAVGSLAAQSIGEPSTQMTLNTFHFAGRGEMNVTLGIPRLREILMLASVNIKTPSMDIPFKPDQEGNSEKLRIKLNKATLADVLEYINVKQQLVLQPERVHQYDLYFKFLPKDAYEEDFCVKPKQIIKYVSKTFVKSMIRTISKKTESKHQLVETNKGSNDDDNDDDRDYEGTATSAKQNADDSSDDEQFEDDDATGVKLKARKQDETEYDDPEVEEELQDANEEEPNDYIYEEGDDENQNKEGSDGEMQESVLSNKLVNDYEYDRVNYLWCRIVFRLPVRLNTVDISNQLRDVARKSVIHEVDKIKRAITYTNNNDLTLKTDGINIVEMFKYNKILDLNRLYTNDIHAVANTYGIEAAARVIVKEVKNVFQVYGITVNPRHLLLIADYMTFDGTFKPLSRKGMEFSASPLQQMSFESCLQFLKSATIAGKTDNLESPSSRLMVGLPIKSGTGSFSMYTKINSN